MKSSNPLLMDTTTEQRVSMECEATMAKDKSVVAVGSKKTNLESPELFLTSFQLTKGTMLHWETCHWRGPWHGPS